MKWTVTFDAKREPMFMDEQGGGWVPIARFNELEDALKACRELFVELRGDWSDNRGPCREGFEIIDRALA